MFAPGSVSPAELLNGMQLNILGYDINFYSMSISMYNVHCIFKIIALDLPGANFSLIFFLKINNLIIGHYADLW